MMRAVIAVDGKKLPRIVIVGGGFAGMNCAKDLGKSDVRVTVIDRSNHHLFQPLLYQVATATLSPADIASPIRSVLRNQHNTEVKMAEVQGVDVDRKVVVTTTGEIAYDTLVIATGARHAYFGHPEWEKHAPGLKSLADATKLREKILTAFELAETETDPEKRGELLRFILVGGGPTGVEMAGAIAELAHRALALDFRHIDPKLARVTLVEAGPRVLASFPEKLSFKAQESLEELGVEVLTNTRVEKIEENAVTVAGAVLRARTIIWTAGVMASPAGAWLGASVDRVGRVHVRPDLTVPDHPEIFVIGDTAFAEDAEGKPLPGVAPVAMQQGRYVASTIENRLAGGDAMPPFQYRDKGNLATIGRSSAVAEVGRLQMSGFIAWWAWLLVHIYYLIGFRNRIVVLLEWAWAYITFQRGARIILPRLFAFFF